MSGLSDIPADAPVCGMPVSLQIERLKRQLGDRLGNGFAVVSTDLYGLEGAERDAALDALVDGEPSPFVLLNGRLVCTGAVNLDAVLGALA